MTSRRPRGVQPRCYARIDDRLSREEEIFLIRQIQANTEEVLHHLVLGGFLTQQAGSVFIAVLDLDEEFQWVALFDALRNAWRDLYDREPCDKDAYLGLDRARWERYGAQDHCCADACPRRWFVLLFRMLVMRPEGRAWFMEELGRAIEERGDAIAAAWRARVAQGQNVADSD